MKISQNVRDFAVAQGVDEQAALQKGMEQKAEEFVKRGGQLDLEKQCETDHNSFAIVSSALYAWTACRSFPCMFFAGFVCSA
jgi:hypothetical protein